MNVERPTPNVQRPTSNARTRLSALRFMGREHLQNVDVSWDNEPERTRKGAAAFGVRRACSRFFARAKAPASRTHSKRFATSFCPSENITVHGQVLTSLEKSME